MHHDLCFLCITWFNFSLSLKLSLSKFIIQFRLHHWHHSQIHPTKLLNNFLFWVKRENFPFFFSQFSAQFYLEVDCVSCRTVFPGPLSSTMSARKLCSHAIKSSSSSFLRRKYFSSSKAFDARHLLSHQTSVATQTVNYSQALGSLTKDQAHDLVFRLNDEERVILMRTLEQFHVSQEKDGLECKCNCCWLSPSINQPDECVCSWHADVTLSILNLCALFAMIRKLMRNFSSCTKIWRKKTFLNVTAANKRIFFIPKLLADSHVSVTSLCVDLLPFFPPSYSSYFFLSTVPMCHTIQMTTVDRVLPIN